MSLFKTVILLLPLSAFLTQVVEALCRFGTRLRSFFFASCFPVGTVLTERFQLWGPERSWFVVAVHFGPQGFFLVGGVIVWPCSPTSCQSETFANEIKSQAFLQHCSSVFMWSCCTLDKQHDRRSVQDLTGVSGKRVEFKDFFFLNLNTC